MTTRKEHIRLLGDAVVGGDVDVFTEVLLANLEVIDGKDEEYFGQTALQGASILGHTAIVQVLLDYGALADTKDYHNQTALIRASYRDHTAIVELLLDHGALVDAQDNHGYTALMNASLNGHLEVCLILLHHGARTDIKAIFGSTALSQALSYDSFGSIRALMEHEALLLSDDTALVKYFTKFSTHPPIISNISIICDLIKREQKWRRCRHWLMTISALRRSMAATETESSRRPFRRKFCPWNLWVERLQAICKKK